MIRTERALVGAEQPPFHKGRHAVDSGKNFVRIHTRALDGCASMNIVTPRSQRVGCQSVGENLGAGLYMSKEKGSQRIGLRVGDDLNATATESFWLNLLHGHSNENLAGSASSAFSGASTANHRFIHLHIAGKARAFSVPNGTTKSVQHRPSRFVGPKPHKAVERLGRNPVFRCCHVPSGGEPYGEWRFRAMEDCARRCRNSATTRFTPPPPITHTPSRAVRTVRTGKSVRPTQPVKIIEASGIIRDPAEKIGVVLWVVLSRLRLGPRSNRRHRVMLASPHLSGYPA